MVLITLLLGLLVVPVLSQDASYTCDGLLVVPVLSQDASYTCDGGDACCDSKPGGCLVGEGDCDNDSHCKGDLVCGKDNCGGVTGYDGTDDCCMALPVPAPVPAPAPAPVPDNETFTFSCNQMKIAHHAIVRAQLSYTCSCQSYTGETTACDREVLIDLLKCGGDDPLCIFKAFNRTSCLIEGKMDTQIICNALNKLSDYVIYNRMAFCAIDGLRGDCGFWDILECTARILAAGAGCVAGLATAGLATGGAGFVGCIAGVLGNGSTCIDCITEIF